MGDRNSVRDADFGSPELQMGGEMLSLLDPCLNVMTVEKHAIYCFSKECSPYCSKSLICNPHVKPITFSIQVKEIKLIYEQTMWIQKFRLIIKYIEYKRRKLPIENDNNFDLIGNDFLRSWI